MNPDRVPLLALVLTLLSMLLYGVADDAPATALAGWVVAIGAWFISQQRAGRGMPKALAGGLIVLLLIATVFRAVSAEVDVTLFCQFLIGVQLVKLLDREKARDIAQLLVLAVFLAIGATLLSPNLWVGVLALVFVPLMVLSVLQFQVYRSREAAADAAEAAGVPPPPPVRAGRFGRQVFRVHSFSMATGVVIAALVFVAMPRGAGQDAFGRWVTPTAQRTAGFDDSVSLGGGGLINDSREIVLELTVRDARGGAIGGPGTLYYLRGAVLENYRDGEWSTRRPRSRTRVPAGELDNDMTWRFSGEDVRTLAYNYEITLRSTPSGRDMYLFTGWQPLRVTYGRALNQVYNPESRTVVVRGDGRPLTYSVLWQPASAFVRPEQEALAEDEEDRSRRTASRPRSRSEVIAGVAGTVLQDAGIDPDPDLRERDEDARAAMAIESYLRENFGYTLVLERPTIGADPTEWFLTDRQIGHCEYFASAMALMCREVGIHARVITGYVATEYNDSAGSYTVRESNAHAWVEAMVAPGLWRRFDPTPPGELLAIHSVSDSLWRRIGRLIDVVENAWVRSIVSYDSTAQARLLGARDTEHSRAGSDGDEPPLDVFRIGLGVLAAIVIVAMIAYALRRLLSRTAPEPAGEGFVPEPIPEDLSFYPEMLRLLRERGLEKPDQTPPLLHASAIAPQAPGVSGVVDEVSRVFYRARYGNTSLSRDEIDGAWRRVRSIRDFPQAGDAQVNGPATSNGVATADPGAKGDHAAPENGSHSNGVDR